MQNLSDTQRPMPTQAVGADALIAAERAERYRIQLDRPDVFPSEQNWIYITDCRMASLARLLYRKYLVSWLTEPELRTNYHQLALKHFPLFINAIDRRHAIDTVYSDVTSSPEATLNLIADCRLFDARHLSHILNSDFPAGTNTESAKNSCFDPAVFVVEALSAYQPDYTTRDLADMSDLLDDIHNLQPIGEVRETRGIFGRETRHICPNGHSMPADEEFCPTCGINSFGFTHAQAANIESFGQRITLLSQLLRKL